DRILRGPTCALVNNVKYPRKVLAQCLSLRPARKLLGNLIQKRDTAFRIRRNDAVTNAGKRGPKPLVLLKQIGFHLPGLLHTLQQTRNFINLSLQLLIFTAKLEEG